MNKINIVIADTDELYLNHLTNYLIENVNSFEVFSFTSKESLVKFLGDGSNKTDVIVFSEDLFDDAVKNAVIPAKLVLSEGTFSNLDEYESVNKYQKADKFVNDILMVYAEKTGRLEAVSMGDKNTKLIGFYSPVGGSGKTTLSVATAYALALAGKRVFYLNAEKINSTAAYLNSPYGGNMSDLYLSVKTKGANVGLKIMANKYQDLEKNITYINPSESSLEINELTTAEFKKLLGEFETLGEFDYVIIDFDNEFSNDKVTILEKCDRIYVPFTSDSISVGKINMFVKELGMHELRSISDKAIYILNKADQNSEQAIRGTELYSSGMIRASIPITPALSDINSIFRYGDNIRQILYKVISDI